MRVVTSNNPHIIGHLESERSKRLGIEHVAAEHYVALEELIRTKHPEMAILDTEMRGGSGLQLCRTIRQNPDLNDVRVLLLLPSVLGRADLDALSASGCDDVLALPLSDDDFFHHIVALSGKRQRKNERMQVDVDLSLGIDGRSVEALTLNMSLGGLGVRLEEPLPESATVDVQLSYQGTSLPPARATVVWARELAGDFLAGLAFTELPIDTRLQVEQLCLFEIVDSPLGGVRVYLHGDIVATTNLDALVERIADANPVELNLRDVRYMSSMGTVKWCRMLEAMGEKRYWFRHASSAFLNQASLVPNVLGDGEVLSFEVPYHCENCEHDDPRLLGAGAIARDGDEFIPPTLRCPLCGGELLFDELAWRYFAFMLGNRS